MRQFAEEELILFTGDYRGKRFRVARQPVTGLLLDAIDSGRYTMFVITGPSQSGKTVVGFILPTLYHLFEHGEDVICGVPDLNMVRDKWEKALYPAIEATRYRDLLPRRGAGSRGGSNMSAVQFRNGATLRFMTSGGDDKNRAGYTGRVLVVTEFEAFGESAEKSTEADKLEQLLARQRSYRGPRRRTYLECTVTIEQGATWRMYKAGTESRIAMPCPKCNGWMVPSNADSDRKQLVGWEDAANEFEAHEGASYACGLCGQRLSEAERFEANRWAVLVHRGQTIEGGAVVGEHPKTRTLGFRWSAFNNAFLTAGDIAEDEFRARNDPDEDNASRRIHQFVWALPYQPSAMDSTPLNWEDVKRRTDREAKGIVPINTQWLTVGLDLGKYLAHYVVIAWRADLRGHVVDYGRFEIPTDQLGVERATLAALRQLRDETLLMGWAWPGGTAKDGHKRPDQVWIDSNYHESQQAVYTWCRETAQNLRSELCRPCVGRSAGQQRSLVYRHPKATSATIKLVGEEFHIVWLKADAMHVVEVNADYWKSWVHQRFRTPGTEPGSLTLFHSPSANEHHAFAKHITAEKQLEEFIAGKGMQVRWDRIRRDNHWFDCSYLACAAGSFCGARIIPTGVTRPARRGGITGTPLTMPDGRPFFVGDRT